MSAEFPGLQGPIPSSSPFNFSMVRPSFTSATTTTQFAAVQQPGPINPIQEAKREACDSPTAPTETEDVQKIQENNNNNQSELLSEQQNSEEVTPPKNQGLIKVITTKEAWKFNEFKQIVHYSVIFELQKILCHKSVGLIVGCIPGSWHIFPLDSISDKHATRLGHETRFLS